MILESKINMCIEENAADQDYHLLLVVVHTKVHPVNVSWSYVLIYCAAICTVLYESRLRERRQLLGKATGKDT